MTNTKSPDDEKRIPKGQPNAGEWTKDTFAAYMADWQVKYNKDEAFDEVANVDDAQAVHEIATDPSLFIRTDPKGKTTYRYALIGKVLESDPSLAKEGISIVFPRPDLTDAGLETLMDENMGAGGYGWYKKWHTRLEQHDISGIPRMTSHRVLERIYGVMGDGTSPVDDYAFTQRASSRLRFGLSNTPEQVGRLEKDGILAKYGTYGIDPSLIEYAIADKPLPRIINTLKGTMSADLGYDFSSGSDSRKLYNFTQGLIGKSGGVAADIWMTRMFFGQDSAPSRPQYDFIEGRMRHMAEVMTKKTGKTVDADDIQAMCWVGYKQYMANTLQGYSRTISEKGNDKAKKLVKTLDDQIRDSRAPGDADAVLNFSGVLGAGGDASSVTGRDDMKQSISAYNGKSGGPAQSITLPSLTVHAVIAPIAEELQKLVESHTVRCGYSATRIITGNVFRALSIYNAHRAEFDEAYIKVDYLPPIGDKPEQFYVTGSKGLMVDMLRKYAPGGVGLETDKGLKIPEGGFGLSKYINSHNVDAILQPGLMQKAIENDPALKHGLLQVAAMMKAKKKLAAGSRLDDTGGALVVMAKFAAKLYPHEVPDGVPLTYDPKVGLPNTAAPKPDAPSTEPPVPDASDIDTEDQSFADYDDDMGTYVPKGKGPKTPKGKGPKKGPSATNTPTEKSAALGGSPQTVTTRFGRICIRFDGTGTHDTRAGNDGTHYHHSAERADDPYRDGQSDPGGNGPAPGRELLKSAEARVPKGQAHGGEWARSPGSDDDREAEFLDAQVDRLPLDMKAIKKAFMKLSSTPELARLYGMTKQYEYPAVPRTLPNALLEPAPKGATVRLAQYLKEHHVSYDGIAITPRTEFRPDLISPTSGWDTLSESEKRGRVATSALEAFDALDDTVEVEGNAIPAKGDLSFGIDNLQRGATPGIILAGNYDSGKNSIRVDMSLTESLVHEFAHYLDYAAAAKSGKDVAASGIIKSWNAFANELNNTPVHDYFISQQMAHGMDVNYLQKPAEVIARFFEGYVMHEALKSGVDLAPTFASKFTDGVQPTLATPDGREALQFEPYTYSQYEAFGKEFQGLLKTAGLDTGVDKLVKGLIAGAALTGIMTEVDITEVTQVFVLVKGAHLHDMAYAGGLHNAGLVMSACQHLNETDVDFRGADGSMIPGAYCMECNRVKTKKKEHHGKLCHDAPASVADMQSDGDMIKDDLSKAADANAPANLKNTDASGKKAASKPGKAGAISEDCYKNPEDCNLKWITAHPDGEMGAQTHLLVHDNGDSYTVVGGAGGSLNQAVFKKPTAQQQADKKAGQPGREAARSARILAAREALGDKGTELQERKKALDAQAKEQLSAIQTKALARLGVDFEGSDAVKSLGDTARKRALSENPKASQAEQDGLADAAVKQARNDARNAVKAMTKHALDRAAMRSLGVSDGGDAEKFETDIAGKHIVKKLTDQELDEFVTDIAALSQTKALSRAISKVLNSGRAAAIDGIVADVQPLSAEEAKAQNLSKYLDGQSVRANAALVIESEKASPATQARLQAQSGSDALNAITAGITGEAILGAETVAALGLENAGRVAAAYLIKKGNSGKAIGNALGQKLAVGSYSASQAALDQEDQLMQMVAHAKASAGEGLVTQNQASILAANSAVQAYRILNTSRGQLRATAATEVALLGGVHGDMELPAGDNLATARQKALGYGLIDGDYNIRPAERGEGGGYIIHVPEGNIDKLAHPFAANTASRNGDLDRLREDVDADPGKWHPRGFAEGPNAPTLAPYQELAVRATLQQKHMILNYGAGTGKTPAYLAAASEALASGKVDRVLMTSPAKPLSQLDSGGADKPGGEAGFFLTPEMAGKVAVVQGGKELTQALLDLKSGKKTILAMTPVTMRDHMAELKAAGFGGEKSMYIADEAHYFATGTSEGRAVKGQESRSGSAMSSAASEMMKSEYAMAGTATAVDNDGSELWSLLDMVHPGDYGKQKEFASEWSRLSQGKSNLYDGEAMRGMRDRLSGGMLTYAKGVTDPKTGRVVTLTNTDRSIALLPEQKAAIRLVQAQYLTDKKSPDAGVSKAAALRRDDRKRKIVDEGVLGEDGVRHSAKADEIVKIAQEEKARDIHNKVILYSQRLAPAKLAEEKLLASGVLHKFAHITGAEDDAETQKSLQAINDRSGDGGSGYTDGAIFSDAANLGVNAQGADQIVKIGPMLTAGREDQLNHRHHRRGQTRDVRTTTLVAQDPLDEVANWRLKNKKGREFAMLATMADDTGIATSLARHMDMITEVAGQGDAAGQGKGVAA